MDDALHQVTDRVHSLTCADQPETVILNKPKGFGATAPPNTRLKGPVSAGHSRRSSNQRLFGARSGALYAGPGSTQKPCAGTANALLNLLERFWKAISAVNSMMASSAKNYLSSENTASSTPRSFRVIASA